MLDQSNNSLSSVDSSRRYPTKDDRFGNSSPRVNKKDLPIMAPQRKRDFARQAPRRTQSCNLGKRTIWKDKGGSARYTLREEPRPEEVKPVGFGEAAKARMTDALLSGSFAGLVVLENLETAVSAAVATKRSLDRQWSAKMVVTSSDTDSQSEESEWRCKDGQPYWFATFCTND